MLQESQEVDLCRMCSFKNPVDLTNKNHTAHSSEFPTFVFVNRNRHPLLVWVGVLPAARRRGWP